MNTAKVHVKDIPVPPSNATAKEQRRNSDLLRLILDAQRARALIQKAAKGGVPNIDTVDAMNFLAATLELYDMLEQLRQRLETAYSANRQDTIFLGVLLSLLDERFDQFLIEPASARETR